MKTLDRYDDSLKQAILDIPIHDGFDNIITISESDYGFAEIYRMCNSIIVNLIPQYGGKPYFHKAYSRDNIDTLITELRNMC